MSSAPCERQLGRSFHRQFREFVKDVHGVDLANDPPPDVQLISDTSF